MSAIISWIAAQPEAMLDDPVTPGSAWWACPMAAGSNW